MAVNGIEIEVGQKWRMRDGRIADVVHDDGHFDYPLDCRTVVSGEQFSVGRNGHENGDQEPSDECECDLIELVEHADGFKPWSGGTQPEETRGKVVQLRMRDGTACTYTRGDVRWEHVGFGGDIVAYKIVGDAQAEEPLHVELIEPPPVNAHTLLTAAAGHTADRASTYDKPEGERSMAQTVAVFKAFHGIELTEEQGWHFMQILKDVRLFTRGSYHADSAEDCIAYAALKAEAMAREGGAK